MLRLLVLGNGAAGAEKQALALGARVRKKLRDISARNRWNVECPPVMCVRVTLRPSLLMPPYLQILGAKLTRNPLFGYTQETVQHLSLVQEEPRDLSVVIGCGRSTVALCAMLKHLEPTRTFNVQIQHPCVPLDWFDTVVVPRHDFPNGAGNRDNLLLTSGTVHDITLESLRQHGCEWKKELDNKLQGRQRRVLWLVGGPCRGFAFTERDAEEMVKEVTSALPRTNEVAIIVTFSRRTPLNVQKILCCGLFARFSMPGQILVVKDTERQIPYNALLATASCIVTTPDSISMTTEAIATGKPVFTIGVEKCKGKFSSFHQSLFKLRATAPLTADAAAIALRCHGQEVSSRASTALENEMFTIADTIASAIYQKLQTG